MKTLAAILLAFVLSSCTFFPKRPDYNTILTECQLVERPTDPEAQVVAYGESALREPETAKYQFGRLDHGYILTSKLCKGANLQGAAWKLTYSVNAKNAYGGYAGWEVYRAYFRGNVLIYVAAGEADFVSMLGEPSAGAWYWCL